MNATTAVTAGPPETEEVPSGKPLDIMGESGAALTPPPPNQERAAKVLEVAPLCVGRSELANLQHPAIVG